MGGKRLAINMIANIVAFVVQFGINFVLTPYIVRTLGSEAYGFVQLSNNVISWISILTVALNSMAGRFICIEINRQNTEKAKEYFNSVLIANTVLAIILMVPSILLVVFANRVMNVPVHLLSDVRIMFAFALIGMEVQLLLNVFATVYYTTNRVDIQAKRNIEGNVLRAVVLVALFASLPARMWYVTGTMMLVYLYLGLADIYYTKKLTPQLTIDAWYFKGSAVKELLSSGVWNSINQLSTVLLTSLDLYLANIFISAQASGEYSLVKTVPNFIQSLVGVLVGVFIPQFTILYARKKKEELLDNIDFSIKVMGYLMMIPVGFLLVFGEDFFHVWVPTQNAHLLQELSVLTLIPMIVTCSINTIFNVYTVTNKLKIPALVLLGSGFANVIVVIILLRYFSLGLWVIPLVAMINALVRHLTFTPIYAAYCLGVPWFTFYKAITRGCCCVATVIAVCSLYKMVFSAESWPMLILAGCVCTCVALVVNLFVVFRIEERRRLVKLIFKK